MCDERGSLRATFVPAAGMLCSSLRHRGEELLAQNAGIGAYAERGETMGIPLLYPWANRLAGFDYSLAGRTVQVPHDPARVSLDDNGLPIHGVIGGRLAWERTGEPDGGGGSPPSLTARLSWRESAPELFEVFPFSHDVHYRACLADGRLEIELTVDACGGDPVPLPFGFHPYLSLPGVPRERWQIELPAMRSLTLDRNQIPVGTGQALPGRRFELGSRVFDDGFDEVREPARFAVSDPSRRIELEFREGYPCAQVFAPREQQFICFEPMAARANALRSGVGLRLLAPGERYRAGFSVRVQDHAG